MENVSQRPEVEREYKRRGPCDLEIYPLFQAVGGSSFVYIRNGSSFISRYSIFHLSAGV